ncbi:MAG TPA: class I SAM-dependent methyltransferase [Anaerolineales bacterium]|nr:class I SAM-dependent methyltransferase [Anaerolineales bacterium]
MTSDERRFDHRKMNALLGADRQARWDPSNFINRFDIRPGASVLDLGSGPGFWTFALAAKVGPQGTVWALDVSPEMLDELSKHNPPRQVRLLQSELPRIDLPDASLDWIWAAFVFHEVTPPQALAKEIFRLAKAEGVAAVLDWRSDAGAASGPPLHHRLSAEQVTEFLRGAGFRYVEKAWQDEDAYLIEARR